MVNDIIINGIARTGKDTFIEAFARSHSAPVLNISSIDPFRKIPEMFGWNGEKDDDYRMCLHLLKRASKCIDNYPINFLLQERKKFIEENDGEEDIYIFYHIREPNEIEEFLKELPFALSLIIRGDEETENACPESDAEVLEYGYDLQVFNRLSLNRLIMEAEDFPRRVDEFRLQRDESRDQY